MYTQRENTEPLSFNAMSAYFIDALTGLAESTKRAYDLDMQQFKLYVVSYRERLVMGEPATIDSFRRELAKSDGQLTDTRYLQRQYRTEIRTQHYLDQLDFDLTQLRKEDIVGYFGFLESGKDLARSTLIRRLSSLRRFFRMLSKEKYPIDPDVVERLHDIHIRPDKNIPIALDLNEALAFLKTVDDVRDRTMIVVMLYMGLRISEVVQLNVHDVTTQSEGVTIKGKGNKQRYVPIHPAVHEAIAAYKAVRPTGVIADADGEPLFVSRLKRRIDPSTVRKMIKKYAAQTDDMDNRKREHLSPHKLRHTFATLLLQGNVDIRYIQELLGHENLSTTQIYTSVNQSELRKAIDRHPL